MEREKRQIDDVTHGFSPKRDYFFVGHNPVPGLTPPRAPAWKNWQWQRSSGVEQRTHKPFVGGSNPPAATSFHLLSPAKRSELSRSLEDQHGATREVDL